MSWFTELAGKAEEFLNKVDKGAATALGTDGKALDDSRLFSSVRSASSSSEPVRPRVRDPSPVLLRKASSPDLSSASSRAKASPGGSPLGARPKSSQGQVNRSNASLTAEHDDEALLEFLNAPTRRDVPDGSRDTQELAADPDYVLEQPAADDAEASYEEKRESSTNVGAAPEKAIVAASGELDAARENSLLRNEMQCLNQELSQLFNKLKANEKEIKLLRQDLDREKENSRRLNSRIREKEAKESDMDQMLEAKDSQVSVLKVRLAEAEEKLRVTDSQLQTVTLENERIIQASTESSSFQSNTVESLRKQIEDLEGALSQERETGRLRNQESLRKIAELEEAQTALAASVAEAENRAEVQAQIAEKRRQDMALADSRVEHAQQELADYKQKAQRILLSKEKLIATLKAGRNGGGEGSGGADGGDSSESMEMEQLRQERDLLREETAKQQSALDMLKVQINDLDLGHQNALSGAQEQLRYQNELLEEERSRTRELQVQCSHLNDELVFLREDLTQQKFNYAAKIQDRDVEIEKLRKQLMAKKLSSQSQAEVETRLQALTQNLIQKQTLIEQLTTEKSALSHQIERMERNRRDALTYRSGSNGQDTYLMMNSTDDAKAHIPSFMVENPLDGRMARRVKRVYSTLDTFSIRLGVFLRRFPIARIMVLAYMGLLHLWVMVVLLTYQPEVHDSSYEGGFHADHHGKEPSP